MSQLAMQARLTPQEVFLHIEYLFQELRRPCGAEFSTRSEPMNVLWKLHKKNIHIAVFFVSRGLTYTL